MKWWSPTIQDYYIRYNNWNFYKGDTEETVDFEELADMFGPISYDKDSNTLTLGDGEDPCCIKSTGHYGFLVESDLNIKVQGEGNEIYTDSSDTTYQEFSGIKINEGVTLNIEGSDFANDTLLITGKQNYVESYTTRAHKNLYGADVEGTLNIDGAYVESYADGYYCYAGDPAEQKHAGVLIRSNGHVNIGSTTPARLKSSAQSNQYDSSTRDYITNYGLYSEGASPVLNTGSQIECYTAPSSYSSIQGYAYYAPESIKKSDGTE